MEKSKIEEILLFLLKNSSFKNEENISIAEFYVEEILDDRDSEESESEEFEISNLDEILSGSYVSREGEIKRSTFVNALKSYGAKVSDKVGGNGHLAVTYQPAGEPPSSSSIPVHDIVKNTTINGILKALKIPTKEFNEFLSNDKKRRKALNKDKKLF